MSFLHFAPPIDIHDQAFILAEIDLKVSSKIAGDVQHPLQSFPSLATETMSSAYCKTPWVCKAHVLITSQLNTCFFLLQMILHISPKLTMLFPLTNYNEYIFLINDMFFPYTNGITHHS